MHALSQQVLPSWESDPNHEVGGNFYFQVWDYLGLRINLSSQHLSTKVPTEGFGEFGFTSQVSVGEQLESFQLLFDTGSSDSGSM